MTCLLAGLGPGDEVIVPSFTFVSTANAFALFGVRPVFADSDPATMNISPASVRRCISDRTRAVVVVHYGGVACDMGALLALAEAHDLLVIEDNAHGLLGNVHERPLGSLGALATLSFHETKNFSCGEGGALVINEPALLERAEVLREKGTNRSRFFRGEVDKYTWVDLGSSYLLADPLAAVLCAQLEDATAIQQRRQVAWARYAAELAEWALLNGIELPAIPDGAEHPAHLFWMWMPNAASRAAFISHMRGAGVHAVFHYQALHASPMGLQIGYAPDMCPVALRGSEELVRLPVFSDITPVETDLVIAAALEFRWPPK
jgi:TDP-4-keto-6-deoxy-D-glucose transaminase